MATPAAQALEAAARLGGFFATSETAGPDWTTWTDLVRGAPLQRRVDDVRAVLAAAPGDPDVDLGVAASLAHLGLVARLLAPPLGAALVAGLLPRASPGDVALHLTGANPLPLVLNATEGVPTSGPESLALALDRLWLAPFTRPLAETLAAGTGLRRKVLDGNT